MNNSALNAAKTISGLPKPHFWMRGGYWLCEADGLIGIGLTPECADLDWFFELVESF